MSLRRCLEHRQRLSARGSPDCRPGLRFDAPAAIPTPRLGVVVSKADNGVKVDEVATGSLAEATALQAGDVIETAAGVDVRRPADLTAIIRRQAPGTWLPLRVHRVRRCWTWWGVFQRNVDAHLARRFWCRSRLSQPPARRHDGLQIEKEFRK